jgi:WD40 repeat protein/energy-coupling factor transporter ATP-binding protein EcfA2
MQEINHSSNPFPGLRPFEATETHLFFGRDGQSEDLLRRLKRTRFLAVVGTSGSGKSSLVRAGLLPALQGGLMASAGSDWRIAILRPGNDPIGNLARALSSPSVLGSRDEKSTGMQDVLAETTLRRSSLGLVELVSRARTKLDEGGEVLFHDYENLLVVIDQFEEIFRFKQLIEEENSKEDAAAFVKLLLEAVREAEGKIYVVLTMRSDFLGDCAQFRELPEAINDGQYLIPRMTRDERRFAITGPVAVGEGMISEPLVNQLLNDVGDSPDQLPIMQHALMRTWDYWLSHRRNGDPMDIPDYDATGGMSEALSRHADEAYEELNDAQRAIAEKMFKGLTEKGTDNREIRRPMEVREICELTGAEEASVFAVVEVFRRQGRSFLMPSASHPLHEDSLLDISHESLIRNWERLKKWVEEEAQSARIYKRLAETAVLHKEGVEALLKDPALQAALDWRERHKPNNAWARRYHPEYEMAMSYLDASVAAREAEWLERRKQQRREVSYKRTKLVAFLLAFSVLLSIGSTGYAFRQKSLAESQRAFAEQKIVEAGLAQQHLAEEQRLRAEEQVASAQMARQQAEVGKLQAEKLRKNADEQRVIAEQQAALAGEQERLASQARGIAEQRRETAAAESLKSRQLFYWADFTLAQQAYEYGNIERGRELLSAHTSAMGDAPGFEWFYLWRLLHGEKAMLKFPANTSAYSISRDYQTLAIGTGEAINLRDLTTGKTAVITLPQYYEVNDETISPDGKILAVAMMTDRRDTVVKLYDIKSQKEIGAFGTGKNARVPLVFAFSPDGRQLIVGFNDGTKLFDVASLRETANINTLLVRGYALSPDGKMLATSTSGEKPNTFVVTLWDLASGKKVDELTGDGEADIAIAFSRDGYLAIGNDKMLWLWAAFYHLGSNLTKTALRASSITALAYSPDDSILAIGYEDGVIQLYNAQNSYDVIEYATLKGHEIAVRFLTFAPDSKVLISGSSGEDPDIRLWDVAARLHEQRPVPFDSAKRILFSPDGKVLAVASANQPVTLLDADTNAKLRTLPASTVNNDDIAFSPDGKLLATAGGGDKTASLWDLASGTAHGEPFKYKAKVRCVTFSPDGKLLAVGLENGAVNVWDIFSRTVIGSLPETKGDDNNSVSSIAFSPNGETLAVLHYHRVELWDRALSKQLWTIKSDEEPVSSIAFSPAGRLLALGYAYTTRVRLFDVASAKELATLIGQGPDALNTHKRVGVNAIAYSRDGTRLATGLDDGMVRIWDMKSLRELLTLKGHKQPIKSVAFSPDGRKLVSVDNQYLLRVWHAATDAEVAAEAQTSGSSH